MHPTDFTLAGALAALNEGAISAEELTRAHVAAVEALRVDAVQVPHEGRQLRLPRGQHQVVVVVHQDPRVGLELRQGAGLGEGFGEKLAVGVVEDDGLTANATPRSAGGEMRGVAA